MSKDKKINGQYFTTVSPFQGEAFREWFAIIPKEGSFLEPFAGSGNLFEFIEAKWTGYDIEPKHKSVIERDTIKNFPTGFDVCITNPPYLAKNSASRLKLDVSIEKEDLYLDCLDLMLRNCDWVAAIVPSTFFGKAKDYKRLMFWDKIDKKLFTDTDTPAGVAYFGPEEYEARYFVSGEEVIKFDFAKKANIQYNTKKGNYVLSAIDKVSKRNIHISEDIKSFDREKYLKNTSRNYVLFYSDKELDVEKINSFITKWRDKTKDFYLTSFKSLMKDGVYRKRISFDQLSKIIKHGEQQC